MHIGKREIPQKEENHTHKRFFPQRVLCAHTKSRCDHDGKRNDSSQYHFPWSRSRTHKLDLGRRNGCCHTVGSPLPSSPSFYRRDNSQVRRRLKYATKERRECHRNGEEEHKTRPENARNATFYLRYAMFTATATSGTKQQAQFSLSFDLFTEMVETSVWRATGWLELEPAKHATFSIITK